MDKNQEDLKTIRDEIDKLDKLLMTTLKQRFKLVDRITKVKKKLNLGTHQKGRWQAMVEGRLKTAAQLKLDQKFTLSLFKLIHKESKRLQSETKDKK